MYLLWWLVVIYVFRKIEVQIRVHICRHVDVSYICRHIYSTSRSRRWYLRSRRSAALLAFDHSNIWAARSALASPCPLAYNKKPRGQGEERTWTQAPYVLELWTPSGPDSGSSALRRALSFCDFQPALHPGDERTCPGFLVPTSGRISTVMTISSSVVVIKLSCLHVFLGIYDY